MKNKQLLAFFISGLLSAVPAYANVAARIKEIARIDRYQDTSIVGYGIVVGLSNSGDSARNKVTRQSLANVLSNFGVVISDDELLSQNTAAVLATARLSSYSEQGDRLDVHVASIGDAKSLAGGTLVLTPLYGPDRQLYALAQGVLSVGGYRIDSVTDSAQKNHPTAGWIQRGAKIERRMALPTLELYDLHENELLSEPYSDANSVGGKLLIDSTQPRQIGLILNEADARTAQTISTAIASELRLSTKVVHPGKVIIYLSPTSDEMKVIADIENLRIIPNYQERIVINERSGIIVAGADIKIAKVSISHGDMQISINTEYSVSQPFSIGINSNNAKTEIVPSSEIVIKDNEKSLTTENEATIGSLVNSLQKLDIKTRDIIAILQAIKQSGAMHAEIVLQ